MKFTAEELFEIGWGVYVAENAVDDENAVKTGLGLWAENSKDEEYVSKAEVEDEIRGYIKQERENK